MAKRFTDTELWDKEWFMKLSPKQKCLVKFVWDKADLAGVWSPNWVIAQAYIGEPVNDTDLLPVDGGRQFKRVGENIVCQEFVQFQYGVLSASSPVHRKVMSILDSHKIPYQYPINRGQEEDKDKEEEKDMVKEEAEDSHCDPHFEVFESFRKIYPGSKRGAKTEFDNFRKKHKDWRMVAQSLELVIKQQIAHREHLKRTGATFIPEWKMLQTWINQRSWEEEVQIQPIVPEKRPAIPASYIFGEIPTGLEHNT